MKKSLMAALVAASVMSPVAFAAEPVELSANQMDNVTAGFLDTFTVTSIDVNRAPTFQIVRQVGVALTFGSGTSNATNLGAISNTVTQN